MDREGYRSEDVARQLFNVLYCTPIDIFSVFTPGHDYGGAALFQERVRDPLSSIKESETFSYLAADPRNARLLLDVSNRFTEQYLPPLTLLGRPHPTDIFLSLPKEMLTLILTCLSSKDVCNLRLSSKVIAEISHPLRLPQSFWASRFCRESEMGYLFAGQIPPELGRSPDWRQIYLTGRNALQDTEEGPGLRNRRRIWRVLGHVSAALGHLLANELHSIGEATTGIMGPLSGGALDGNEHRLSRKISGELLRSDGPMGKLQFGCRLLESKRLYWPQMSSVGGLIIALSFVWLNSRSYLSGVRICHGQGSLIGLEIGRVGLIIPSAERRLKLDHFDRVNSLEVAANASGILGLRFNVQRHASRHSWAAGNLDATVAGVGVGRLQCSSACRLVGLAIELDVRPPNDFFQLIGALH